MLQGVLRLLLAGIVVYGHLLQASGFPSGNIAVFGFYLISGFLICRVVTTRYSDGWVGLWRFALNRFLRLYPAYFAVLLMSVAAVAFFPTVAATLNPALTLAIPAESWPPQLAIVGLMAWDGPIRERLIPPAWSLNIELLYYALIAVLFARSKRLSLVWWLASIGYAGYAALTDDFSALYSSYVGPSVAFSSGAMLWHHWPRVEATFRRWIGTNRALPLSVLLLCAVAIVAVAVPESVHVWRRLNGLPGVTYDHFAVTVFGSLPLLALTLLAVTNVDQPGSPLRSTSDFAGQMSYPLFLCHWPVAVWTVGIAQQVGLAQSRALLGIAVAGSILVAAIVVLAVERPFERLRARVRSGLPDTAPSASVV